MNLVKVLQLIKTSYIRVSENSHTIIRTNIVYNKFTVDYGLKTIKSTIQKLKFRFGYANYDNMSFI